MVCTGQKKTTLNHRTGNINASLHVGFLCLRLYFHEYVDFINHYSDQSTLEMGREERGRTAKHHMETFQLPCRVQGGEMRSVIVYMRRKKGEKKGGNSGPAGDERTQRKPG